MDFEVVKSGWLYRQSSILKRWKRCWFVLYRDGYFKHYDNPNQNVADGAISIGCDCSDVISEVRDATPPPHLSRECLLAVSTMSGETWIVCAESPDDRKAWEMTLNDMRLVQPVLPPPPYSRMVRPPPYCANNQVVAYTNQPYAGYQYPSQTTVVYADQPCYYRRNGTDLAVGMMAGAALGSMMWGPILWW